jgi:hypothetical protein
MDLEDDQTDSGVCCVSLASISKLGDVPIDSNLETMLPISGKWSKIYQFERILFIFNQGSQ